MREFILLLDFLNCLKPLCTRKKGKQKNMFCRTFDQLVLVKLRKITWLTSKVTVCVQIILVLKKKDRKYHNLQPVKDGFRTSFFSYNTTAILFRISFIREAFLQELKSNSIFYKQYPTMPQLLHARL